MTLAHWLALYGCGIMVTMLIVVAAVVREEGEGFPDSGMVLFVSVLWPLALLLLLERGLLVLARGLWKRSHNENAPP